MTVLFLAEDNSNKSSVTRLFRDIAKASNAMAITTEEATVVAGTVDGATDDGPGNQLSIENAQCRDLIS